MKKSLIFTILLMLAVLLTGCGKSRPQIICTLSSNSDYNTKVDAKIIADLDGDEVVAVKFEITQTVKKEAYDTLDDNTKETTMKALEEAMKESVVEHYQTSRITSKIEKNVITVSADLEVPEGYTKFGTRDSFKKGYDAWDCREQQ